tara:strand:+ start:4570 stop:5295 length:726 start_codon:yes stop_codon:yes gene_type:complete
MKQAKMIKALMEQYKADPSQFSDEQAEQIAIMARKYGMRFPRESKAIRKALFDTADTALLGLLPNSMRPVSRGEETFGETGADRWAGNIGTGLGIIGTGGLALAKAPMLAQGAVRGATSGIKGGLKGYYKGKDYAQQGVNYAKGKASQAQQYARDQVPTINKRLEDLGKFAGESKRKFRTGNLESKVRGSNPNPTDKGWIYRTTGVDFGNFGRSYANTYAPRSRWSPEIGQKELSLMDALG